ncbi:type III secretion system cytoplasmic ring protein SctQ [Pseudomonas entomophila]|uniref:type III secretion system cytoplasmic ring protein SctQ n=1 Tax=Pseudomonas entomophila TaxID=312306 RepID=UPI0024072138|nr:type III secretion system cytoplasmic ring protein SctQ [Pseudomonas entomophila]MDF9618801.1 type III secretion system cytoplasmic ring protein SctQ [Pseudomonas entomophila]
MTTLNLPNASPALLALQRRLSRCRTRYPLEAGVACLAACPIPETLDCRVNLHWRGLALQARCNRALLASWLAPDLQEAAFANLPLALQLTLLQRHAALLPGLTVEDIGATALEPVGHGLRLTLGEDLRELPLWILGDLDALLENLPARPLQECLPLPLQLSLQWPAVTLPLPSLRTLALGDVLLLPSGLHDTEQVTGHVQGRAWATLLLHDNQFEIITMLDTLPDEPTCDITDLEQLPVQVNFEIGRQTLDLHTLATLQPGSLIDLATPLDGEVRILVNQRCIGTGELVEIQDRFGVRVQRLLSDAPA